MTPLFLAYAALGYVVLCVLWWTGHPAILDPGGYGQPTWADEVHGPRPDHWEHFAAGLLLMAAGAVCNGFALRAPLLHVAVIGALWELAQRYPRKPYSTGKPGFADYRDWLADVLGALVVAGVGVGVRAVVV